VGARSYTLQSISYNYQHYSHSDFQTCSVIDANNNFQIIIYYSANITFLRIQRQICCWSGTGDDVDLEMKLDQR
jgi:hypothetical protein